MGKNDIGSLVAENMFDILNSKEHKKLFKKANDEEKDNEEAEKEDKNDAEDGVCRCPEGCKCYEKHGKSHSKEGCECHSKEAAQKVFSEILVLSSTLDNLGLGKSAGSLLNSAKTLIVEATHELFGDEVDTPEEMASEIKSEIEVLESVDPDELDFLEEEEGSPSSLDLEGVQEGVQEAGQERSDEEAELDALLRELEQVGSERTAEEEGELAEVSSLANEVDSWINKNADEDMLAMFSKSDLEFDVSLSGLSDSMVSRAMEKANDEDENEADDEEEGDDFEEE